ncbi:c-type cytochrome [Shinella sp. 838]|uniref:c-type cytochrome n=1 Tax=unclassified Shinella TaxID=2643062 RepID=UPI000437BE59|nr:MULTISPECIES: c-type cytochrome [unclassified Shinella]EYR80013.1 diheme cytochrome c-type [Shinella sp. DD12]MCA0339320.1 c-type cytochrome [Pseudomonadota bacterium]MDG4670851.1 c-type cytochrome [Shinella sp. 838]
MRMFRTSFFSPGARLAAAIGLAVAAFCPTGALAIDQFAADAYGTYKANAENGKLLFGAAGCGACHGSGDNTELLSGGMEMQTAIGKFFAPNISAHPNGIGGWSNADFLNAVMVGLKKSGDNLYPVMPYTSYGGMKPEDVLDIKAYIETLPQSDAASKEHEIAFPFSRQTTITLWKRSHFTVPAYQPREETQMERGRYLVENVGGCGDCHTPRTTTYGLDLARAYEGEKGLTGAVAPDITKARMAGLASHEVFTKGLIDEGKKLSGSPLADPVMRRIAQGLSTLSDEDKQAMYAFLADREVKVTPVETSTAPVCSEATAETALAAGGGSAEFASAADAFIGKYCRNCHGPGESSQGSFPSGDLASIAANPAFVTPGDAAKSLLYTSVTSGRMPLGKRPDDAEVQSLANWINSLNKDAIPTAVSATKTERSRPMLKYLDFVELALRDVSKVDEHDQPFMRYFSYRDQYNGMMSCESHETFLKRMKVLAGGFKKLLNSLSYGPELVLPEEVEGSDGLLVRVDLRDLEWSQEDYDFLINEYFYGVDPASDAQLHSLAKATQTQLPIMRVDWFMSNGARPKVYNRLMKLPTNISELEKRFGVPVDQNIERRRIVRAGFADGSSGVSDHNRMLERHDMPFGGYYWKSYDFAGDVGKQVLKRFPAGPEGVRLKAGLEPFDHDGGEMIFSLPNGMQGYYLSTDKGDQLDIGPTAIVSFRKRPIGKGVEIINARSCFDCHFDGILSKRDQLREHIETSTLFSKDQQDELLAVYVPQEELNEVYKRDTDRFVAALDRLGITEATAGGGKTSLKAPGGAEIFTYFADKYEDELNFEQLAAEFDMTPEEFASDIRRLTDVNALRIGIDWVATLESGATIPRVEVEEQYAFMLQPLLQLEPLKRGVNPEGNAGQQSADNSGYQQPEQKPEQKQEQAGTDYQQKPADQATGGDQYAKPEEKVYVPPYKQDDKAQESKVKLALHVPSTSAKVGDYLAFELSTNHACELQVMYVEDTGNVEIIPDVMIGSTTLNPGERRLIPQPGTGNLTFDSPSPGETMIAYCRIGGLGDQKLTAEKAKELAASTKQPLTRGIAVNLAKQAEKDNGASGVQMVTFEIK